MLFHRPAKRPDLGSPAAGRRFLPGRLPIGLTQAIGHIRDKKCRELLDANEQPPLDGPLRTLQVRSGTVSYARGVMAGGPDAATMIFLDGAMLNADARAYELLDLDRRVRL